MFVVVIMNHEIELKNFIRHARMANGQSIKELSIAIGCSMSMISKIENGKTIPTKGETLKKISQQFSIDYVKLIEIALKTKKKIKSKKMKDEVSCNLLKISRLYKGKLKKENESNNNLSEYRRIINQLYYSN